MQVMSASCKSVCDSKYQEMRPSVTQRSNIFSLVVRASCERAHGWGDDSDLSDGHTHIEIVDPWYESKATTPAAIIDSLGACGDVL